MGIEKTRLLVCESVYYIIINTVIESTAEQCATCMEYQQTKPCEKIIPHEMLHKPWEVVGANIFTVKNNLLLCIVDYYSKFPVIKKTDGLSAGGLIRAVKIGFFSEFRLSKTSVRCRHKFNIR